MSKLVDDTSVIEKFLGRLSSCKSVSEFELHPSSDGTFHIYRVSTDADKKNFYVCLFSATSLNPELSGAGYQYDDAIEVIQNNFDCWVEGMYHTDGELTKYTWPLKRSTSSKAYLTTKNQYDETIYCRLFLLSMP